LLLVGLPLSVVADNYHLTSGRYSERDDLFQAVWDEFHKKNPDTILADWHDIRSTCADEESEACSSVAELLAGPGAALLLRDGMAFCPGGQYFVLTFDDDPPRRYRTFDRIDLETTTFWLLCGAITAPILTVVDSQPVGLVAPDWQLYLSHLRFFAPHRVRQIWAHLEFHGFGPAGELLWRLEAYDDRHPDDAGEP
jgi:hypothetical protein